MSLGRNMVSVNNFISPITTSAKNLYNKVPSVNVAKNNIINSVVHIGEKWTSPQQRVIMGITAVMTQPFIDAKNKKVDDKTRRVSVARTLAKIIAGTATGFAVRYLCIKGIKYSSKTLSEIPKNTSRISKNLQTLFTPDNSVHISKSAMDQYRNAMGTFVSLGIMMFTNFLIDAPWTKKLTNIFVDIDNKMRGENKQ